MKKGSFYEYYSRDAIQKALIRGAKDREIAGVFQNGSFSKRPNALIFQKDIESMMQQGVEEFHCSLERWSQPMAIRQDNYDDLRKGWDLILDLDCKEFEHGKTAAIVVCNALEQHDIRGYSVKFTGNRGFHVGVPWESMPQEINGNPLQYQFPDTARTVANYLREFVREELARELTERFGKPEDMARQAGIEPSKVVGGRPKGGFDPFAVVDVDPVLISPRHLYRMPYSMHKNSGLVSVPVDPKGLEGFSREMASPDRIKRVLGFLEGGKKGESESLFIEAMDWHKRTAPKTKAVKKTYELPTKAIPIEHFPPCINNILNGIADGKKRSLFILTNFLSSAGWKHEDISELIMEWNSKNLPPLRESYVRTHMRWHQARMRTTENKPPPSCNKEGYYISIGVCKPDGICGGMTRSIKNPINYPLKKMGRKDKSKKKRIRAKPKKERSQ